MKTLIVIAGALTIAAFGLSACATTDGPYASATSPSMPDHFHGTMKPCGALMERKVCFDVARDR